MSEWVVNESICLIELLFAVYARKTVKQKCKRKIKIKRREMQEVVRRRGVRGGKEGKKEKGKMEGCTRITFVLVLSEIMSWQGQLQVFTGGNNLTYSSVGGSLSART